MGLQNDLAVEYSRKYADAPNLTVAKALYADNPGVYRSVEAARSSVRRARGAMGEKHRHRAEDPREPQKPGFNLWEAIPDPIGDFGETVSVPVEQERVLVLSDIHIPFHDKAPLIAALEYGKKRNADAIVLNGDIMDCYEQSRFEKDPRLIDWGNALQTGRAFMQALRSTFPNAEVYFKDGNHDERYEAYLRSQAPVLLGDMDLFDLGKRLGFDSLGIKRYNRKHRLSVGRLDILHGHEFGKGGGVNPARWIFLKALATVMIGHLHRTSQHSEPDIAGKVTSTWSTGCLCGMSPDYARYNKWNQGFAFVESDGRDFRVDNLRFIDGRIY